MKPFHAGLLVLVAIVWGGNFSVVKFGLQDTPPLALSAMRFVMAALACLFLPRPKISWSRLAAIGMTLGTLMSAFQFAGMKLGAGAAVTSILLQSQIIFTTVLAMFFLSERPSKLTWLTIGLGVAGLGCFLVAYWHNAALFGLGMVVMAAFWWAVGNLLVKGAPKVDAVAIMAWMSLVPILPLTALSLMLEGPPLAIAQAVVTPKGLAASLYLGLGVMIFGYGIWGKMLQKYDASTVAPFSLLVPVFGIFFGMVLFDERLSGLQILGVAFLVAAVFINMTGHHILQKIRSMLT
jgi:O-acetylserine/cysteine efflux transporter